MNNILDIVIPVYGQFGFLQRCLDRLPEACDMVSYNVIIVDNASLKEENPDKFYETLRGDIFVIRNKKNLGFPKACNIGARRKQGKYILFLNSDAFMFPNSIKAMVEDLDNEPNTAIVGAKLVFPKDTPHGPAKKIQHVGLWSTITGDFEHAFLGWNPEHPKVLKMRKVLAVTGAALMIRRSIWNLVGGFGEEYGLGTFEDLDLCMKVQGLGKDVIVEQKALGEHWVGRTAVANKMRYPLNENRMTFLNRWNGHYPWSQWEHV